MVECLGWWRCGCEEVVVEVVVEGLGSRVDPSQTKGSIQPESGGLNMSFPISL